MSDNIIKDFRDLTMTYSNFEAIQHNVMRAVTIIAALNTYKEYNLDEDEYMVVNTVYENYMEFKEESEILNKLYYRLLYLFRDNKIVNDIALLQPFNDKVCKLYIGLINDFNGEQHESK